MEFASLLQLLVTPWEKHESTNSRHFRVKHFFDNSPFSRPNRVRFLDIRNCTLRN